LSFKEISSSLILEHNERLLKVWNGDVESTLKTIQSRKTLIGTKNRVVEAKDKDNGALALTTERLIWLKRRGVFSKSYHTTFEIPLEEISGISETGMLMKRICVSDKSGEYRFSISENLANFKNLVNGALTERKKALDEMRKKDRIHVMIDFSSIGDYMEKGGLQLTTVKCPNCNAPLKLPNQGTEIICQYCNSTILAQDIFEKIKSLI